MFQRGWFLVDVPDEEVVSQLVAVVQGYGVARVLRLQEGDAASALLAERGRVAGIIVRPRADHVTYLGELRAAHPALPVLALCGSHAARVSEGGLQREELREHWRLINTAQRLGIELAQLPVHVPNVVSFVQRALSASFLPHDGVARVVSQLARSRGLTAREVQILTYCLGNETRKRVRRRLGIAENTLKTQIRSLLRKCDERNVDALAKNVLRAALFEGKECREPVTSWYRSRADAPRMSRRARLAESA